MVSAADNPALRRPPPGPSSWPFLGNLLDFRAAGDAATYFDRLWRTYGDTVRFKLLGTNAVLVSHPDALKQVLSTRRERYIKGKIYDSPRGILGDGLVTLEGDPWKARRAMAQPAFHRQSLAKLTAVMARSGARFLDDLAARASSGPLEIDAHREMVKLTLDVVIAALLGDDLLRGADVSYEVMGEALRLMSERGHGIALPEWVPTPQNI
jgi:cytochrome P450